MKTQFNCYVCDKVIYRSNADIKKNQTGRFFCSHSCSASICNKIPKRKRKNKCKLCDALIMSGKSYCKGCYEKKHVLAEKTISEATKNRKDDANRYTGIRCQARKIFFKSQKPKHCAVCGYKKHIEICHIKDISSFSTDTLISVVNSIDNLVGLCPNHHWEFDRELLSLEEMGRTGFEPVINEL